MDNEISVSSLRQRFGIPGVLSFDEDHGLKRLHVTTPQAQATMYLQGAQLTAWQPAGQEPVLFLSRKSEFAPGKPIRGGIPIVFPWFATDSKRDRVDGHPGPMHGFARIQEWMLQSAKQTSEQVALKLTVGPTEMSRSMGYDHFLLTLEVLIGETLTLRLTVANGGTASMSFEEAFHSYFSVMDVHEATVTGLESTAYIDKTDGMKIKPASGKPVTFTGPTDRVYLNTEAPLTIHDGAQRRDIHIAKTNSRTTVVFNPWKELPDLGEWDWHEMLAVETANTGANAKTLAPGEAFTMGCEVRVERWKR